MRIKGLEPSLLSELEPKSSASANFAISASVFYISITNHLWQWGIWNWASGIKNRFGFILNSQCERAHCSLPNVPCPIFNQITPTRGRRCLNPQRISQEMVFNCFAQSSAVISSFASCPSKVTISPSCIFGKVLTSSIN